MAIKERKAPSNVGSIVWWNISGEYQRTHIEVLAKKHTVRLPKKAARSSFTNALRDLNRTQGMVVKKHSENMLAVVHVIAEARKKVDVRELEWGEQSWVQFEKLSNAVIWKEKDPRTEAFAKLYKHHQEHYTAQDIRMMVEGETQRAGAISVRSSGGIYFLPESARPKIMALSGFLDDLGSGAYISIVGIPSEDTLAVKSIQRDFEENGYTTVDGMFKALDEAIGAAKGVDAEQRSRFLKQLVQIEKHAESMEELLHFRASKLTKRISEVRGLIKTTIEA